jgi:hypothetical protein
VAACQVLMKAAQLACCRAAEAHGMSWLAVQVVVVML